MDKNTELIGTKHSDGSGEIRKISRDLISLANSFADVGNTFVCERLYDQADRLVQAAELMDKVYIETLSGHTQFARAMTGNLLAAALRGKIG